ncbi:hypothetical protein M0R45_001098 [Rubus argutus]|uniref:Uncharacterized protein n=1 Tax=Rubus argutus TaxID=59490 RepID=A0AAW1VMK4_RUBAR
MKIAAHRSNNPFHFSIRLQCTILTITNAGAGAAGAGAAGAAGVVVVICGDALAVFINVEWLSMMLHYLGIFAYEV